jgi:Protein of unknown function (DUF4012)
VTAEKAGGSGLFGVGAVLLALGATLLWLFMFIGPWRLASGLIGTEHHLSDVQSGIKAGKNKVVRYETLSAVAAAARARSGLGSHSPLFDLAQVVPVIGRAWGQVEHLVDAAHFSAAAAKGTLEVSQNALKGPHKVIRPDPNDPGGGKTVDLDEVAQLGHTIDEVHSEVDSAAGSLMRIELSKLPHRLWNNVNKGIRQTRDTGALLTKVQAGFKLLPDFLGANGPRRYLLGMQNSGELRGTGGAILQFGSLSVDNGAPHLEKPKTVYKVDKERRLITIPLPKGAWYVRGIPDAQRFGNSNWSPDWAMSARLMLRYANATDPKFPRMDGVIAVDPVTMQELMQGTGPFRSGSKPEHGRRVTRTRVLSLLLHKAYATFPRPGVRRAVLKKLVSGFYNALLAPKHPTGLLKGLGQALTDKHMQIWMADPQEEAFAKVMHWDGGLDQAKHSDYLNVVEQNVGGNKLDYFERQENRLDVTIEGRSAVDRAEVTVINPVFVPQPRYWLGDSGPYDRPMINVYAPERARLQKWAAAPPCGVLITKDNMTDARAPDPCRLDTPAPAVWTNGPAEHLERGKKVWSATLQIPAQEQSSLAFAYRVPGVVRTRGGRRVYRLVLQHQPKVNPERLTVALTLPPGAAAVKAPGFTRKGESLVWRAALRRDKVLTVSWRA